MNSTWFDPDQEVDIKLSVRVKCLTVLCLARPADHPIAAWPHASDVIAGLQRSALASFAYLHDEHTAIRSF